MRYCFFCKIPKIRGGRTNHFRELDTIEEVAREHFPKEEVHSARCIAREK
ncbi:hypothetical protein QYZ87_01530 [Porphyromonadaceae bacterium W3.11]|nr:hypothetical protein [Porphyromonadaceae bacterium W3.11]